MAGYCTHCGGSGFRNPAKERQREARMERFVRELAQSELLDPEYQSEEGCDQLNTLVKRARKLIGSKDE